jgi:hypothetical protein
MNTDPLPRPGPHVNQRLIDELRRCAQRECYDCAYVLTRLVASGEITPVDLAAQIAINEGPEVDCG